MVPPAITGRLGWLKTCPFATFSVASHTDGRFPRLRVCDGLAGASWRCPSESSWLFF